MDFQDCGMRRRLYPKRLACRPLSGRIVLLRTST
jgi:hypothetical protein